jgi:hypothetical protein
LEVSLILLLFLFTIIMTLNNNTTFASMLQHHGSSKTSTLSGSFTDINKSAIKAFAFSLPLEARKVRLTQTHGFCFIDPAGQMGKLSSFYWHLNPDGTGQNSYRLESCSLHHLYGTHNFT